MRWPRLIGMLLLAACLSGCTQTSAPARYVPQAPNAVFPATTCLPTLGSDRDVATRSAPDDRLLAAVPAPRSALICSYRGPYGPAADHDRHLDTQTHLGAAAASRLAAAAADVSVASPPTGPVACPADLGTTTLITFTYPDTGPVTLWWATSGCQTIDNGHRQASQLANTTFTHFQTVFTHTTHPH